MAGGGPRCSVYSIVHKVTTRGHRGDAPARDTLCVWGGEEERSFWARRHPGAGGAQRLLRLRRPRPLARGGARPRPRPHLQPQHQSHGRGVRGEGAAARRGGGRNQRLDRDGRDLGNAARAARARRSRGVGQGHLRRHQPPLPARPAPARHRGGAVRHHRRRRHPPRDSPPAAGCSIWRARPIRP